MPTKLRKSLSLCNAIGVPCHRFLPSHGADKGNATLSGSCFAIHTQTKGLEKPFISCAFALVLCAISALYRSRNGY
jgi:hypothetical protein